MPTYATFIRTDRRLNATEFAHRLFPKLDRDTAGINLARWVRDDSLSYPIAQALQKNLAGFIALLRRAADPTTDPRALLKLASDTRLVRSHIAQAIYPNRPGDSVNSYWAKLCKGNLILTPELASNLREYLLKLAQDCEDALK